MATCHRGSGQPLDEVTNMPRKEQPVVDTNVELQEDPHSKDADQFEDLEHDLCHHIHAEEREPTESLHCIESELQGLSISLNASAPTEPLKEVWKHYMDTLCSAQKQTNFTTLLLQDISIFTGQETTLLEDWLTDIETVADLTSERQTKLAQAKSKDLTHTLISEALTSGKSWDKIKDLLRLKICNSDIHTSILLCKCRFLILFLYMNQKVFLTNRIIFVERDKLLTGYSCLPQVQKKMFFKTILYKHEVYQKMFI